MDTSAAQLKAPPLLGVWEHRGERPQVDSVAVDVNPSLNWTTVFMHKDHYEHIHIDTLYNYQH